jgi:hypothetical protein
MGGAIHESPLRVRRNDEVEAQRRRWTFYETIKSCMNPFSEGYHLNYYLAEMAFVI